jgi:hypothetical protein
VREEESEVMKVEETIEDIPLILLAEQRRKGYGVRSAHLISHGGETLFKRISFSEASVEI